MVRRVWLAAAMVFAWGIVSVGVPILSPVPVDASVDEMRSAATRIAVAFADAVGGIFAETLAPPSVDVRNTPYLAYFDHRRSTIVLPHWPTLDAESRAFFLGVAGSTDAAGSLFARLLNDDLVAHEMTHWLQRLQRIDLDRYESERDANDLAVAFFRATDGGVDRLAELRVPLSSALEQLRDPTPSGVEVEAFFNVQYGVLAADPCLYGDYPFRFILALLDRSCELEFTALVHRTGA